MIEVFTSPTPNGIKIPIALEEMGIAYKLHRINLGEKEQKRPEFLAMNPNGKIPVIVDTEHQTSIFESGAILIYLAEKSGQLMPLDILGRSQVIQWVMFQIGGIGPNMGQAGAFSRMETQIPAAIERFQTESRRLYSVLDEQLAKQTYLTDQYSIADITNWSWVRSHQYAGLSLDDYPNINRWYEQIADRDAVKRGLASLA